MKEMSEMGVDTGVCGTQKKAPSVPLRPHLAGESCRLISAPNHVCQNTNQEPHFFFFFVEERNSRETANCVHIFGETLPVGERWHTRVGWKAPPQMLAGMTNGMCHDSDFSLLNEISFLQVKGI